MDKAKQTLVELDLIGLDLPEAKDLIKKHKMSYWLIREGVIKHPIPPGNRTDRFLISTSCGVVVEAIVG